MDSATELVQKLRPFLVSIASSVVSRFLGRKIITYHTSSEAETFEVSQSGLTAALAAAVSGDYVLVPSCSITGDFTVPAGVILGGLGGSSIIYGTVTLGASSGLHLITISDTGTGARTAVVGPASGTAYIRDCNLAASSSNSDAFTIDNTTGNVQVWNSTVSSTASAGTAYAVRLQDTGNVYLYWCVLIHETLVYNSTSGTVTIVDENTTLPDGWSMTVITGAWVSGKVEATAGAGVHAIAEMHMAFGQSVTVTAANYRLALPNYCSYRMTYKLAGNTVREVTNSGTDFNPIQVTDSVSTVCDEIEFNGDTYSTGGSTTTQIWDFNVSYTAQVPGDLQVYADTGDTTGAVSLSGDRAAFDATNYASLHTNDTDDAAGSLHHTIGTGATQAAAGNHDHGTRTENVLVAQGATAPALKNSHIKDLISGAFLASVSVTLTGDHTYTLQDSDMTIAAINLAQTWTQSQTFHAHGVIGSSDVATVSTARVFSARERHTGTSGTFSALSGKVYVNPGAAFSTTVYGCATSVELEAAQNRTAGALIGLYNEVIVTNGIAATNLVMTGGNFIVDVEDAAAATAIAFNPITPSVDGGSITNSYGARIEQGTKGAGSITTQYGVKVESLNNASTNYALYTGLGLVRFGDQATITTAAGPALDNVVTDAVTNAVTEIVTVDHESSGTPAAGFGARISAYLESSTTARQLASAIDTAWSTATHAARTGYAAFSITIAGTLTEIMRITSSGVVTKGRQQAVAIKSGNYVLTGTDEVVVFTATATATLPAATGTGQTYRIVCRAGLLTIDGNASETVKGELTQILTAGEDLIITDTATGIWE